MKLVNYREAAEQRPPVARSVSYGSDRPKCQKLRQERKKITHQSLIRSPLPGLVVLWQPYSHGCRRGLLSRAAPRLNGGESAKRALDLAFEVARPIQRTK